MILQALTHYYQRMIERQAEDVALYGYSPEKISYEIVLTPDGRVVAVNDIRDTSGKKPQPKPLVVPQVHRTSGIEPAFLWDKTSYVLGVSATSKRADKEHEAFKTLHQAALSGENDDGMQALLAFLRHWSPGQFQAPLFPAEMQDTNVVFRLDGDGRRFLHEREAAQALRARLSCESASGETPMGVCLVSGQVEPLARLHPPIKGVLGAQSSGAAIVAFNDDAYLSYKGSRTKAEAAKKENNTGANAPVSEQAAFAYSTALNYLLRRGEHNRQRLQVGDTTVVFWAEAAHAGQVTEAEDLFADLLNRPADDASEAKRVREVLDHVAKGRPLDEIDPKLDPATRMYVLGLAPNASRLSVRFWQVDTLDVLARRIAEHTQDLRLEPLPWRTEPSAYRLVLATVPRREGAKPKADDAINIVIGEMMRAILSGGLYPRSLLANTIMRLRADGDISGLRVALCKGVLAREWRRGIRTSDEEIPVSLDKQSTQPGYVLGRLFAVLEYVQRCALGSQVNATIRDRYYGAASATPATIFPVLLRNTQNHLGKLRKEKAGLAVVLEKDIREIVGRLPEQFPRSLKIEDQGRFAIGYYHQSQAYFTRRDTPVDADASESAEPTDTEMEGAEL
ncbi:type I-C CRISPR-associated protein Cas8c/Csd1 [Aromatoleum sp.]|uniref:type I-C CRISPR-associated protein Cas8c/Csd1 n=1 Tax=Aromatoleum sp. TaxID=2307007 RepID=UPI002FCA800C